MNVIVPAAVAAVPEVLHTSPLDGHRMVVVAGVLDDIERDDEDNGQGGYEDAEDAAFWGIVRAAQDDACVLCGFWTCRCTSGLVPVALTVLSPTGGSGQCNICGGWFDDWDGGTCDACKQIGY